MGTSTYIYDQARKGERERLRSLEVLLDGTTRQLLEALGVGGGSRCLEVGCGAGGVAAWLSGRAGPDGAVVATDLDPRFLAEHGRANLEVRRHDILSDPLEEGAFDIAHARCLLEHLPERERALERMVSAVRPGSWVLIEDAAFDDAMIAALSRYVMPSEEAALYERSVRGFGSLFAAVGADLSFGARLPKAMSDAGLENVSARLHAPLVAGGGEHDFIRLSLDHVGAQLVGAGLMSQAEVDRLNRLCGDPSSRYAPLAMVSAWGRRPR